MGSAKSKQTATNSISVKQYKSFIKNNKDKQHNEFIQFLVVCYCNDQTLRQANIVLPIPIISIIVSYCDIDVFGFNNYDKSMFQINQLNRKNRKKFVLKKIQDYEHATIIFGNKLKQKGFAFENFDFVFRFQVISGIIRLLFVPSTFNPRAFGYITDDIASKHNLQIQKLNGYFCKYDDIVRVKIDMMSLCVEMINETCHNISTNIKINSNVCIAFSLMNPYAQINIIDQHWERKQKKVCDNTSNDNDSSDDDIDVEMIDYNSNSNSNSVINNEINQNNQQKNKLPSGVADALQPGLNYIGVGKCDASHKYAICNRGLSYDREIRPTEDYFTSNVICTRCNSKFKYDFLILHDCSYVLQYAINQQQGIQRIKGAAYGKYIDIHKDILKGQSYNFLTINTTPTNPF